MLSSPRLKSRSNRQVLPSGKKDKNEDRQAQEKLTVQRPYSEMLFHLPRYDMFQNILPTYLKYSTKVRYAFGQNRSGSRSILKPTWIKTLNKNSVLVAHFVLGFLNPALTGKCKTFVCKKTQVLPGVRWWILYVQERFSAFSVNFLKQIITHRNSFQGFRRLVITF